MSDTSATGDAAKGTEVPARMPGTLRLVTYNVQHGRGDDGKVDLDRFARAVEALDADVLALQEVERNQQRSGRADLTGLAAQALSSDDWHFSPTLRGAFGLLFRVRRGGIGANLPSYGIGLVSRFPVERWHRIDLPRLSLLERLRRVDRSTFKREPGGMPVLRRKTLRVAHQLRDEPRAALAAVVRMPEGPVTVVATHLTALASATAAQLEALTEACAGLPRPLIVLGDLNLAGERPATITGWTPLATAPTHPVHKPKRQIDHILADGAVRPAGPGTAVDTGLSDHRALVVDVTIGG